MLKDEFKQWQTPQRALTGRLKGASLKMTQQQNFKWFEVVLYQSQFSPSFQ